MLTFPARLGGLLQTIIPLISSRQVWYERVVAGESPVLSAGAVSTKEAYMLDAFARRGIALLLCSLLVVPFDALLAAGLESGAVSRPTAPEASPVWNSPEMANRADLEPATDNLIRGLESGQLTLAPESPSGLRPALKDLTVYSSRRGHSFSPDADAEGRSLFAVAGFGDYPHPVVRNSRGNSASLLLKGTSPLMQAEQSKPIGTGAHGKMTLPEKANTFRIGSLSHSASVALMVVVIGGLIATAIIVPLSVGD
jgi:hypothetical protein